MREKGSHKSAANHSSLNIGSSESENSSDGTTNEALLQGANDEIIAQSGDGSDGNGAGKMATNTLIEKTRTTLPESAEWTSLNEDVDWSLSGLLNNPSGVDVALKNNLAIMEQQTRDLIENGSIEDLLAALDENTRQLEMLQNRMEGNLSWLTGIG